MPKPSKRPQAVDHLGRRSYLRGLGSQGEEEETAPGSLLKFVDSSGQDITMEVKVSATPEKASRTQEKITEELVSDPEIDEEKDFTMMLRKFLRLVM